MKREDIVNDDDDCEAGITYTGISSFIPKLPDDEEFSLLAGFFSVFSDSTRLKIISALSEKELCVHELSSLLNMKQPSVSQHLKMLWQARVVKKRKVGLHVFYRLDDQHIEKIYTWGYEHVKE
ncbi:metalloregulator ArsR/SmtB family transcription factor [uncultured Brachyspira sp.]|uniref:ArsR/SmtB family transcription factor n=1 Tax=uncultured Brachyspira sp. TaxID=221953 RepID=UPI0025EE5980|nr:metalloregulator ArsR/SmtB family transcription factor [uncultured Brachyspira sp.]